jgi:hypothetical protein
VHEKSLLDLLNAYLAIESLLSSRYISEDTRSKAVDALRTLNQQFKDLVQEELIDSRSQAAD